MVAVSLWWKATTALSRLLKLLHDLWYTLETMEVQFADARMQLSVLGKRDVPLAAFGHARAIRSKGAGL